MQGFLQGLGDWGLEELPGLKRLCLQDTTFSLEALFSDLERRVEPCIGKLPKPPRSDLPQHSNAPNSASLSFTE